MELEKNEDIELAWEFINSTHQNVFLTGKAGTGKTTFLHHLKHHSLKRTVVVAPTGVAAINAKGVTIHSFFQLPFGPILPDVDFNNASALNRKFSKTKIDIIRSMDLLIIDEISMVRADVLDGIDKTLKRFRDRNKVFGGVQVLMIGDLQQLSPVIRENEWQLLKPYYQTGYFFSSHSYQKCNALTIELRHIYRQENPQFIEILNEIRNNTLSDTSAKELNKRYIKDFKPDPQDGYIALTTHNHRAEQVNAAELAAITSQEFTYKAKVSGKFPDHAYPNSEKLKLKVGAQVMFIKNDSSPEKRYFNGKIGKVIGLEMDEVVVQCPDENGPIITTPEEWENINYSVNVETKAITENKIGSFSQMPLRLAWAITIHKSQGLTFEKAIVDAQDAFAHGQTYVALSRCKSLEGLILKSRIDSNQIINDHQVSSFTKSSAENPPDKTALTVAKREFQLNAIHEVFDFYKFLSPINRLLDIFYKNRSIIHGQVETPMINIKEAVTNFLKLGASFNQQLTQLCDGDGNLPETNNAIQERFKKAIAYFQTETANRITANLKLLTYSTDNKAVEKDLVKSLETIEELLAAKFSYFKGMSQGFSIEKFLELKAKAVFLTKDKPKKSRASVVDGTVNIELFELLRELRNEIAHENDLIHYQIFSQNSLYEICETLPITKKQLLEINGFGKIRVEKYGTQILEVIKAYCDENDIQTHETTVLNPPEPKSVHKRGESDNLSLELYKLGKSISEIAAERDLVETTIFGHLLKFVASGDVKVTDLISEEHVKELTELIPKYKYESLTDLKRQLDDKYSYNDIKVVLITLEKSSETSSS